MQKKRGQYFEIDAIIAIAILIVGFIYVKSLQTTQPNLDQNREYSQSCVNILRDQKVRTLETPMKNYLIASNLSDYTNDNNSVSQQIAVYYIMGNKTLAANLTEYILDDLIPPTSGYEIILKNPNEYLVYRRDGPQYIKQLSVGRTLISGIQEVSVSSQTPFLWGPIILECRVWE